MNDNSRRIDLTYQPVTTTGNLTVGNCVTYPNNFPSLQTWPSQPAWSYPPTVCSANYHVFSCNHALACKCGKVARPEPLVQTCPDCGATS